MSIDRININKHGIDNQASLDKAQEAQKKEQNSKPEVASTGNRDDSIALSPRAQEIQRLSELVPEAGDRSARISLVRDAIENGTYKVSGEDIANKIIDTHKR